MRKYKKKTIKQKRRLHRHTSKCRHSRFKLYKKTPNLFGFKMPILYSGGDGSSGTPTTINSLYIPYKNGGELQNTNASLQASSLQAKAYAT